VLGCFFFLVQPLAAIELSRPFFGSSVQDVSGSIELGSGFAISPDSRFVIFTADFDANGADELYRAAADGSDTVRIGLNTMLDVDNNLRFSPNGRFLLFEAEDLTTGNTDAFIVRLDLDSQPLPINLSAKLTDMTDASSSASLLVTSEQFVSFYVLGDVAGTPTQRIVTVPIAANATTLAAGDPTIVASGALLGDSLGILWGVAAETDEILYSQAILLVNGFDFALFSVPAAGGTPTRLDSINIETDDGTVIDAGLGAVPDEISPNGQIVLYQRAQSEFARNNDQLDLYAVPIDGGTPRRLNASLGERRIVGLRLLGGSRTMNAQGSLAYYLLSPEQESETPPINPVVGAVGDLYVVPTRPEFGDLAQRLAVDQQVLYLQDILFQPGTDQLIYTSSSGDANNPSAVQLYRGGQSITTTTDSRQRFVKQLRLTQDGSRIVFVSGENLNGGIDHIFSHAFDSGITTLLASSPEPSAFFTIAIEVTPDGQRVIFGYPAPPGAGLDDLGVTDLLSVSIEGGEVSRITPELVADGVITPNFRSSPDSRFVVYRANRDDAQRRELFRAETRSELIFADQFE